MASEPQGSYRLSGCEYTYHWLNLWCPIVWIQLHSKKNVNLPQTSEVVKHALFSVASRHPLLRASFRDHYERVWKIRSPSEVAGSLPVSVRTVQSREEAWSIYETLIG